MRNFLLISLILITNTVFAGGSLNPTDEMTIGNGNNAIAKKFIFNVGDGISNPFIYIDPTNKDFTLNKELKVLDSITVGTGLAADQLLTFDIGLGAGKPFFKWDNTNNALVFSNDGTLEKKIGTGDASGGSG